MSTARLPSWDDLLDANTTASEAAAARGVSVSAAKIAACRRKRSWKSDTLKVTDEALRKIAKKNPSLDEVLETFGITASTAYRRVARLRGIVFHKNRLWTERALKKAHAEETAAKWVARAEAERAKTERAEATPEVRKVATVEASVARPASRPRGAFSVSPEAIERYLAKTAQARREVA